MREGWIQTTLGEMAKLLKERNNSRKLARVMTVSAADGLVDQEKYFKKSVASSNLANYRVVNPGDFVYNKSTSQDAPMGVITQWNGDGSVLVSPIYLVFRTESDTSIDSYLKHYFKSGRFFASLQGMLREGARAHGALNVRQDEFLSAELVLPPLHEQRRIVDLMDSVDAAISAAQAEIDAAVKLRQRALWNALAAPSRGWEQTKFGEVAETLLGKSLSRGEGQTDGGTPYLRYANVGWGTLDTSALNRMTFSEEEARKYSLRVGDLLVAEARHVGKCVVVNEPLDGICYQNSLHRVRANEARTSNHFLALTLEHLVNDGTVARFTTAQTIPHLSQSKLRALPINLPPLDEQRTIVETMSSLHAATSTGRAALDRLRELRSSMLTVLLSGEHEIPESYDQFLTDTSTTKSG